MTKETLKQANILAEEIGDLRYQVSLWNKAPGFAREIELLVEPDGTYTIAVLSEHMDFKTIKQMVMNTLHARIQEKEIKLADL